MAYDWNKLKQDSIIGFSYSSSEEEAFLGLKTKVKDLVKASILLRSSPDFVEIKGDTEPGEYKISRKILPALIAEELRAYIDADIPYEFQYFVRYCHYNKFALDTDLVIDLYDFFQSDPYSIKWLSLLLEDFQLEMLYAYDEQESRLKKHVLEINGDFQLDLILRTAQRNLWKDMQSEDKKGCRETMDTLSVQLKEQSSTHLDYIETLWLRQMDQDGFLLAEINKVLDTLKSDKISFKKSSSAVFLQAVHFGTLKRAMGVEHLKAIIEVPEILQGFIHNVYVNNDSEHAFWLIQSILQKQIAIDDHVLIGKLIFGLSAESYKALWTEILMEDLLDGNEAVLVDLFLSAWQTLPWSLVKRILTILSPAHVRSKELLFLNRLTYVVSREASNEALDFLSSVNSRFLEQAQLVANVGFGQLFAKRNGFLHLLNKYGHLPKG